MSVIRRSLSVIVIAGVLCWMLLCLSPLYGQLPATRFSLSFKDTPLKNVFNEMTRKTGYDLFYSNQQINDQQKVSVSVKNATVQDVLTIVLGSRYTWVAKDNIINIKKKEEQAQDTARRALAAVQDSSVWIRGRITDQKGGYLQGASVQLRGTGIGVVTDEKGLFVLKAPAKAEGILDISYVGYKSQELPVRDRRVINVTMSTEGSDLNDIIVIGYGTARKKDLTAAVSSVGKEALSNRTLFSLADAMKGKAAGVQITQNDGTPGSEYTIRIRGASSVSAASTPLYVIDGVMQDDANNINPGDIESLEILKDASGTAIYGARGANGVVIITTKTGKAGKTSLELYSNVGFQRPGHLYKLMDASEYARDRFLSSGYTYTPSSATDPDKPATTLVGYTYYRDRPLGQPGGFWGVATDQPFSDWQKYNSRDSVNTDWQKAMFQNSTVQEYRVSLTGGSKDTKFSFLGGYLNQGGLIVFSGFKRYTGRFNIQQKLSNAFTLTGNISSTRTETDGFISTSAVLNGGIASNSVISSMLIQPPTKPLSFSDVEDNEGVDGYITTNPYSLAQKVTNVRSSTQWLARIALDGTISKNLSFRVTGNYTTTGTNTDSYYPKYTSAGTKFGGRAVISRGSVVDIMNENLLYYKGKIGRYHQLNIMGGAIFEQNKNNLITAEGQNFAVENLGVYGLENGTTPIIPTYNVIKWTMASFLSRAEYSYQGKYLATVTMRADGSSRFSKNNKWGYFPSAALAWRISSEPFMRDVTAISNLKLRTSWGQSGNTAIPSYLTLSTIGTYFSPMDGNTPNYGVVVERPENNSLKWETTTQVNAGIDLGLFNDKVNITAEWYQKKTKDLLIQRVVPAYSGYRTSWTNLGAIQNTGVEISLGMPLVQKTNFSWNIDANIAFNRSRALDVGADLALDPGVVSGVGNSAIIRNGQPIGQWFGYQTNGIYQSQADIDASGLKSINGQPINTIRPGTRRFIDQNNDSIINTDDRVVLGQGQPSFTGGLTNALSYMGFGLNVVLQYSVGNKIYNANRVPIEASKNTSNRTEAMANSWRPSLYDMNTGALYEAGNASNEYRMPGSPAELLMLSNWVENGNFLRLSDVTLSYNIPAKQAHRLGVNGINVFVSGKNLVVWTKYSGYDPEVNTRQGGFGDLMPSLDYASYPRSRIYSFGVKVQL